MFKNCTQITLLLKQTQEVEHRLNSVIFWLSKMQWSKKQSNNIFQSNTITENTNKKYTKSADLYQPVADQPIRNRHIRNMFWLVFILQQLWKELIAEFCDFLAFSSKNVFYDIVLNLSLQLNITIHYWSDYLTAGSTTTENVQKTICPIPLLLLKTQKFIVIPFAQNLAFWHRGAHVKQQQAEPSSRWDHQ